jgi:hypothetical protein
MTKTSMRDAPCVAKICAPTMVMGDQRLGVPMSSGPARRGAGLMPSTAQGSNGARARGRGLARRWEHWTHIPMHRGHAFLRCCALASRQRSNKASSR